jgi:hypothetical protein
MKKIKEVLKIFNESLTRFQQKHRRRGQGESIFGALTNWLGDRLKTSLIVTTIARIGLRLIAYLTRIYIRITIFIWIS